MRQAARSGLVAAIALVLLTSGPAAAGGVLWAWATSRITSGFSNYEPLPVDQGTASTGGHNRIYWFKKGQYVVTMEGLGSVVQGIAHVTPLGTTPRICTVEGWGEIGGGQESVTVGCWDLLGHPANAAFSVNYLTAGCCAAGGYQWVDDPVDSYFVCTGAAYHYNSSGGCNHIAHDSTGHYTVTMAGLGGFLGNVQVTAFGNAPTTCRASHWGSSPDQVIGVTCRNRAGNFVNSEFDITYLINVGLRGVLGGQAAHFWADRPTASTYLPFSPYRYSSSGQGPRVTRSGPGKYLVHLLGITTHGGSAQVTAYGTGKVRCQVSSISTTVSPETVGVRCFKPTGAPVDSMYSFVFTR